MIKGKKMRATLKFILYCGADPRCLGIEDDEGKWDFTGFKRHIEECEPCKRFWKVVGKELLEGIEKEFGRAKRAAEGSKKGVCPQPKQKPPRERSSKQWKEYH